jgi:hypothetical protein
MKQSRSARFHDAQLNKLAGRDFSELKGIWSNEGLGQAPRIRHRLMAGVIAYSIQEKELGGLGADIKRKLREIVGKKGQPLDIDRAVGLQMTIGTRLKRIWRNELHEVEVIDSGFLYRGESYRSLSVIARKITHTQWSGPAFFGLRKAAKTVAAAAVRAKWPAKEN